MKNYEPVDTDYVNKAIHDLTTTGQHDVFFLAVSQVKELQALLEKQKIQTTHITPRDILMAVM